MTSSFNWNGDPSLWPSIVWGEGGGGERGGISNVKLKMCVCMCNFFFFGCVKYSYENHDSMHISISKGPFQRYLSEKHTDGNKARA